MKLFIGIILSALFVGFSAWSIIAYPAEADPWEVIQLTAYQISGQEEKVAEIEKKIENCQQSPEESEEVLKEENYPHLAYMP